jgi:2-desacetyl-2-hydroxyethyl bacteriochlorophyllide A dehydrogenase
MQFRGVGEATFPRLSISLQSKLIITPIDRRWFVSQELLLIGPRDLRIVPCDDPPLRPDEIRATAILSGISHGTELNLYRGTSPFHDKRFDPDLRLFVPATEGVMYPARIGYEWVGRVTDVGADVSGFAPGDLIHLPFSHRATHTARPAEQTMLGDVVPLPSTLDPDRAIVLALAGVALQAVHDAHIKVGDHVAIFGLGVIGLLAVQFARLNGALRIDAVDPLARRRALAEAFGADCTLDSATCDVAREIKSATPEHGADVAIELSGSVAALHEAIRCVRVAGTVVAGGYYQGGAAQLRLGEEWHHNRITMVSSMGVWDCPHRDYPAWDRARIHATATHLLATGRLRTESLISHRFPFARAAEAYALIDQHPDEVVKVVLTY